jgi:hypothetical protein
LGHEQTSRNVRVMSVIPPKADIHQRGLHVRLVPEADITRVLSHFGNPPRFGRLPVLGGPWWFLLIGAHSFAVNAGRTRLGIDL